MRAADPQYQAAFIPYNYSNPHKQAVGKGSIYEYTNIIFVSCPHKYPFPLGFFLYKIVRLSEQRFHFI